MIHETFSHYNIGFIRHRACCGNEEKHFFLRASVPTPTTATATAATRAYMRASGVFLVFAFTSSSFGCISLKISVLRVKVSLFCKTIYLPLAQWLMGEGSCLHLNAPNGGQRHDKNDGAKCPAPRRRGRWRQRAEKCTRLPSPATRCDSNDCEDF